jgi:hypothetical protein
MERITTFDERFYKDEKVKNKKTGKHIFVSTTHLIKKQASTPIGLTKWILQNGWDSSQRIMKEAGEFGTIVHNEGENMIIDPNWGEPKYSHLEKKLQIYPRLARSEEDMHEAICCLIGMKNFLNDNKFIVEKCESKFVHPLGYGGTKDIVGRYKDKPKKKWLLDWKTSKYVWDTMRIQGVAYMKHEGADRCGVVRLGTQFKRYYSIDEVKVKDHNRFWGRFLRYLEDYYADNPDPQPKVFDKEQKIFINDELIQITTKPEEG